MREILFKGKCVDCGEWVEGCYIRDVSRDNSGELSKFAHRIQPLHQQAFAHPIDPSTLCQYTGLTDKNGRKIWENDIVKHYNVPWEPAQFTKGVVYWNGENLRYERSSEYTPGKPATVNSSCVYEVIGNAFDNPELLEKSR